MKPWLNLINTIWFCGLNYELISINLTNSMKLYLESDFNFYQFIFSYFLIDFQK